MKASDYIAAFLEQQGVTTVYEVIGGMITHIIDSLYKSGRFKIISMHHEQAAGFAAEATGRLTKVPGVAMATSGPGATNLITAIGSCYFDSSPVVFITGQVNTYEMSNRPKLRQQGFQETDIVSIARPITKAVWQIQKSDDLPAVLFSAFQQATAGRPGPVLIDIPMNIQRENIESNCSFATNKKDENNDEFHNHKLEAFCKRFWQALKQAQRPLIIAGGGIRASKTERQFRDFAEKLKLPVVYSLMGADVLPYDHPLRVGFIGTYGNRWANKTVMSADLILVLGSRLDIRQTGAKIKEFQAAKQIFHLDIDPQQINNRLSGCDYCISHLSDFFSAFNHQYTSEKFDNRDNWLNSIKTFKEKYPDCNELNAVKGIHPNLFIHCLTRSSAQAGTFIADVGKNQMWMAQSMEINDNQRALFSGGMGAMGFALPAAIGAAFSTNKPVLVVAGDGGLQCNIQELQTVVHHNLPVKIVVLNNNSLGMVQQFQEDYFQGRLQSTRWGYSAPDFEKIGAAYNIPGLKIEKKEQIEEALKWLWQDCGHRLLNVIIESDLPLYPKVAFGKPLDQMDPPTNPDFLR